MCFSGKYRRNKIFLRRSERGLPVSLRQLFQHSEEKREKNETVILLHKLPESSHLPSYEGRPIKYLFCIYLHLISEIIQMHCNRN